MNNDDELGKKIADEKRQKIELRNAIDLVEVFLEKLKKVKCPELSQNEIEEGIINLKKIIKAVRGYHAGVTGLLSSFEVLYKNLEDLNTGQ